MRYVREQYLAFYQWRPTYTAPVFDDVASSSVAEDFGLLPADVTAPAGAVHADDRAGPDDHGRGDAARAFPGDGLDQMRAALRLRVGGYSTLTDEEKRLVGERQAAERGYEIGDQVWLNDLLCMIEAVHRHAGDEPSAVQHDSTDVSGVAQPLDALWTLATGDITITIT